MKNNISYLSYMSHVDSQLEKLRSEFIQFPFHFFNEYEIHYWYSNYLTNLMKKDNRHNNMRIIREFPTSLRYMKDKRTGLKSINDKNGRRGYIDLVIEKEDIGNIGFEFIFEKEIQLSEIENNGWPIFLHKRQLDIRKLKTHITNDLLKLKSEKKIKFSRIIIFSALLLDLSP